MDFSLANSIVPLIIGAAISDITTYLNHIFQVRRDIMKYDNDRKTENEKREFEEARDNRIHLIQSIEKIHGLLCHFEYSISLTSSVIDSSNKMKPEEFDTIYRKELELMISLKSLVCARFPDFYDNILQIDGHHNNYWGNQRLLLRMDVKTDIKRYQGMQMKIIEIANKTSSKTHELINILRNRSEKINNTLTT